MLINYQELLDKAMHSVIKNSLEYIAKYHDQSLGEDSFLISFVTSYPGVVLSEKLRQKYPQEMIIVLQYQFDDLTPLDDRFNVTLYFNGAAEVITIPYSSVTSYVDKRANFALNFHVDEILSKSEQEEVKNKVDNKSNVIFLDQFRK
jgi:hypothetical protein